MRAIEGIPVDRAKLRLTGTYALTPRLAVGVEWNPLDDDVGPLANWRLIDETRWRPAFIIGTSSDRIGTPSGRAYYGTFSKDLEAWTRLPIAPYVGAAYGEFEDEWVAIGGLRIRWAERWSTTSLWDGENLHHTLDVTTSDHLTLGAVLVQQDDDYYGGLRVGASF